MEKYIEMYCYFLFPFHYRTMKRVVINQSLEVGRPVSLSHEVNMAALAVSGNKLT